LFVTPPADESKLNHIKNDGSIWFGSGGGVYRNDGKTIMDFKSKEGKTDLKLGNLLLTIVSFLSYISNNDFGSVLMVTYSVTLKDLKI